MDRVERILRALRTESHRLADEAQATRRVFGDGSAPHREAVATYLAMRDAYEIARKAGHGR